MRKNDCLCIQAAIAFSLLAAPHAIAGPIDGIFGEANKYAQARCVKIFGAGLVFDSVEKRTVSQTQMRSPRARF